MPRHRILVASLAAVTIAVTLLFVLTPVPRPPASRPTEVANLVLRGYDEGTLAWEATAARGGLEQEASELEDIVLRIFDHTESAVRVTARSLSEEGEILTLRGDVRGEASDLRISTEAMTWSERRGKLESGPTLLTYGSSELTAQRFAYDTELRRAELDDVRGSLARATTVVFSSARGAVTEDQIDLLGDVRVAGADPAFTLRADAVAVTQDGWTARGQVEAEFQLSPTPSEEDHET